MTEFSASYAAFIDKLGLIASKSLNKRSCGANESAELKGMIGNLIGELSDQYAQIAVSFAASQISPSDRSRLLIEMNYFNNLKDADERDGDTVKLGIEDFLGTYLPGWLKDHLKILSEILSLSSGGNN